MKAEFGAGCEESEGIDKDKAENEGVVAQFEGE